MKKESRLFWFLSLSFLLTACGQLGSPFSSKMQNPVSQATTASSEQGSSSVEMEMSQSIYEGVLEEYQSLEGAATTNQQEIWHSLYDVDKDGRPELLVAIQQEGIYSLIDLYTWLAGGEVLRLTENLPLEGQGLGQTSILELTTDGRYLLRQGETTSLYYYDDHIPGLKGLSEPTATIAVLDLNQLTWERSQ